MKSVGEIQEPLPGLGELTLKSVPAPPVPQSANDRSSLKPLAPQRYALQVTIDQETHDALCHAQDLLGYELPAGDIATVLGLALQALVAQLEKRKSAAWGAKAAARGGKAVAAPATGGLGLRAASHPACSRREPSPT